MRFYRPRQPITTKDKTCDTILDSVDFDKKLNFVKHLYRIIIKTFRRRNCDLIYDVRAIIARP